MGRLECLLSSTTVMTSEPACTRAHARTHGPDQRRTARRQAGSGVLGRSTTESDEGASRQGRAGWQERRKQAALSRKGMQVQGQVRAKYSKDGFFQHCTEQPPPPAPLTCGLRHVTSTSNVYDSEGARYGSTITLCPRRYMCCGAWSTCRAGAGRPGEPPSAPGS
jgi:hypothetical protein